MKKEYFYWLLGFLFLLLPFTASAYQIDQAQTLANQTFSAQVFAPAGQSFVPRQGALLGVTLKLSDAGGAGMGNWLKIQLRSDAMDGEVVAVSRHSPATRAVGLQPLGTGVDAGPRSADQGQFCPGAAGWFCCFRRSRVAAGLLFRHRAQHPL